MRIRSIKPEFFRSPSTARASFKARILFQAMWCWADDFGVGETNLYGLLGSAFCDEDQVTVSELQSLCKEVADAYGAMFYEVDGRFYFAIPSWDEHQKTQRRTKKRKPGPDHPGARPDLRFHNSSEMPEHLQVFSESLQGKKPIGTGEQGNRGTGEQASEEPEFARFWDAYPKKSGKGQARTAFERALKKTDLETLVSGAEKYRDDPTRKPDYTKNGSTWLNGECWDDEMEPAVKVIAGGRWEGD